VRFGDFLKATVYLSAGAATLLATVTVLSLAAEHDPVLIRFSVGWWLVAALLGARLGRRSQASPAIARLLAGARSQTMLPELRPAATLLVRLWALLLVTFTAGILGFVVPQVAAVATGFAMIWALAWRRQHSAVAAIEERDAVRFYVDRTPPLKPIRLVRTPGFGGAFLSRNGRV
jgi:hypothetical protein